MSIITKEDAQAWVTSERLTITTIDADLEQQIVDIVMARIAPAYDVSSWTSSVTTPKLVRTIIATMYMSWLIHRYYAESEPDSNEYALRLAAIAEANILSILNGTAVLTEETDAPATTGSPAFYPTDASSAAIATSDDRSLGGPAFSMGQLW
jgi:hypothetical protein